MLFLDYSLGDNSYYQVVVVVDTLAVAGLETADLEHRDTAGPVEAVAEDRVAPVVEDRRNPAQEADWDKEER